MTVFEKFSYYKMSEFPDSVLARIGSHLNAMDRMRLQATCRRFREIYSKWKDIVAIEIRSETYGYSKFHITIKRNKKCGESRLKQ